MSPAEFVALHLPRRVSPYAHIADVLQGMKAEIGHEERGGRVLVDLEGAHKAPGMGDVIGRTPWVGSRFWFDRPDPGLLAPQARAAIDKALSGQPLGARESRFVEYAAAEATNRIEGGIAA